MDQIRLQKFLSEQGVASRRNAEKMIKEGIIRVNNVVIREMGVKIDPEKDTVMVRNKKLSQHKEATTFIILYKPKGYTCTHKAFEKEKNIFTLLPKTKKLICVGRLDKNSEGLVLLTNNGEYANMLIHPKYEHEKEYEVTTEKTILMNDLLSMCKGLKIEGQIMKIVKFKLPKKKMCTVVLKEGKKRQIRLMFREKGYRIKELKRIRLDIVNLGKLKPGQSRKLSEDETKKLLEQL